MTILIIRIYYCSIAVHWKGKGLCPLILEEVSTSYPQLCCNYNSMYVSADLSKHKNYIYIITGPFNQSKWCTELTYVITYKKATTNEIVVCVRMCLWKYENTFNVLLSLYDNTAWCFHVANSANVSTSANRSCLHIHLYLYTLMNGQWESKWLSGWYNLIYAHLHM